jgi:hypothetical protein
LVYFEESKAYDNPTVCSFHNLIVPATTESPFD